MHEISQHNTKFWVSDEVYTNFSVDWFSQDQSGDSLGWNGGRQPVIRLTRLNTPMILRHYCRGGLPAKLTRDLFMFSGYQLSRPYQELLLLDVMHEAKLPVPKPIAAKCQRAGLFYRADILITEIEKAKTLVQLLSEQEVSEKLWLKIGQVISRFHKYGIQHVDLNANNILIDNNDEVFLIDFDRCKKRNYAKQWAEKGLARLARSLNKEKSLNSRLNYEESMFAMLLQGYEV